MKKLSLILASALLLGGISFAAPRVKQVAKPASAKQTTKPAAKPAMKPAAKPAAKPAVKPAAKPAVKPATKPVVKHGPVKKTPPKKIAK